MKKQKVFKVVLMEDVTTSSLAWGSFIKAESKAAIERYVNNSDCKMLYIAELDAVDVEYLDKPINELIDGVMVYND
jgi:hypothetical protein